MKMRTLICLIALLVTALLVLLVPPLMNRAHFTEELPGVEPAKRQLLRVWVTGAPGGGMRWLQARLAAYEKAHPGVSAYVRQVTPQQCADPDGPAPDVLLFLPGDFTAPEKLLRPLSGISDMEESLLRCGRWQGLQYAVPLCWGAWVLAVDSAWDHVPEATPAPTTLLGRPAPTPDATPEASLDYPLEKIGAADVPLLAPKGAGLFTLSQLLPQGARPQTGDDFATRDAATVYQAFLSRKTASALLTTGQVAALESAAALGRAFPYRVITPEEIITDQVWMAGVGSDSPAASALVAWLLDPESQQALTGQGLFGVHFQRRLYAAGVSAQVEAAAQRGFTAVNAFAGAEGAAQAAWQVWQGSLSLAEALLPLI